MTTAAHIVALIADLDSSDAPAVLAALAAKLAQPRTAAPIADNGTPTLVDAAQAAAALNVPESQIRSMARQGKIPSVRMGKYIRFDIAEVAAALRKG